MTVELHLWPMSLQEGLIAQNCLVYLYVVIAALHRCLSCLWFCGFVFFLEWCHPDPFQRSREVSPGKYAILIFIFPPLTFVIFLYLLALYSVSLVMLTLSSQQWGKVHGHVFSESESVTGKIKYGDIPPRKLSFIERTCDDLVTEYILQLHTAAGGCKED